MNKNELANKIRRIDGLTNGEKSALIELLRKQKKYGLVWEDKPEDVEERLREELPVLIEDTGKAIISEEADAPNPSLRETTLKPLPPLPIRTRDRLTLSTSIHRIIRGIRILFITTSLWIKKTPIVIPNGCRLWQSVFALPNSYYRIKG